MENVIIETDSEAVKEVYINKQKEIEILEEELKDINIDKKELENRRKTTNKIIEDIREKIENYSDELDFDFFFKNEIIYIEVEGDGTISVITDYDF